MNQNLCCLINGRLECSRCFKRYCDECEKKCKSYVERDPTDDRSCASVCECGSYLHMTERAMWEMLDMVEEWRKEREGK